MKDLFDIYGVRCDNTDPDNPGGKFKDESTEGADDGTPFQEAWCQQVWSFGPAVLNEAGVSANGIADTVVSHQVLNELIKLCRSNTSTSTPESDSGSICSGLPPDLFDWSNPNDTFNKYSNSNVLNVIRDACVCWDTTENKPFIAVLQTNGAIYRIATGTSSACWNYSAEIGRTDIEIDYPSTPDQVEAIACDGNMFFVAWSEDSGHHHVSAYSLAAIEGNHVWTRDTLIDKVGGTDEGVKLIVAQNGTTKRLALQVCDGAGGAGSARTTAIINSFDGALVGSGVGSLVTGSGDDSNARCRPISDGAHVFWIGYQTNVDPTTRKYFVMSASIANPDTSTYGSKEIANAGDYVTADTWTHPKALALVNDSIFIFSADGTIQVFDPYQNTFMGTFGAIEAPHQPTMDGNQDVLIADDGMSVWATSGHEDLASVSNTVAYKVPKGALSIIGGRTTQLLLSPSSVVIRDDVPHENANEIGGRLLFDGRDLWFFSRSADVYRIVNPGMR